MTTTSIAVNLIRTGQPSDKPAAISLTERCYAGSEVYIPVGEVDAIIDRMLSAKIAALTPPLNGTGITFEPDMEGIEDSTLDIVFSIIDEIGEAVFKETGSLAAKKVCAMIIATIMQRLADIEEIHTEL